MSIYKHTDYRDCLKDLVEERRKSDKKITFAGMADTMLVQKTLVSKVMNRVASFNQDQLFLACEYLGVGSEEAEYLQLLLEFDRCDVARRKSILRGKIELIRERELKPARRIGSVEALEAQVTSFDAFYLDPMSQLVHAFLIIPKFAATPRLLIQELGLAPERLAAILKLLEKLEIIRSEAKGAVRLLKRESHLSPSSAVQSIYQQLTRLRALERLPRVAEDQKYLFSVLLTIDRKTFEDLRQMILEFLKGARARVTRAEPESVYQMNIDLLKW